MWTSIRCRTVPHNVDISTTFMDVDIAVTTLFLPFIIFAGPILRLLGQNVDITRTVDEIYEYILG